MATRRRSRCLPRRRGPQSLTADQRAELDELRSLLDPGNLGRRPSADLEDRVVTAIAEQAGARPARPRERRLGVRLRWHWSRPVYAGARSHDAAVAAIAVILATSKSSPPPRQFPP
jgi:hypothetical protein